MVMGPPIRARPDFDVEVALKKANEERMRREDLGDESADEREVEEVHPGPATYPTESTSLLPSSPTLPTAPSSSSKQTVGLRDDPVNEREADEAHPGPATYPTASASPPFSPSPTPPTAPLSSPKRTRKQEHVKSLRARNRAIAQALEGRDLKMVTLKRRQDVEPLYVDLTTENLGAASSGWVGGRVPTEKETYTIDEVTKHPFNLRHVQWDGW
jgi:hypothetical protein